MSVVTNIRVIAAEAGFEDFSFRTPLELSTGRITAIRQVSARVRVAARNGREAVGFGAMFLGDLWAWPSGRVNSPQRVAAMGDLCERLAVELPQAAGEFAHPLEHGMRLCGGAINGCVREVEHERKLPEAIPHLAVGVCLSPFDAAIHDAFGRLHGVSAYEALHPRFLPSNLDTWLGETPSGRHISEFFRSTPTTRLPGWHVVSKGDALTEAEVHQRLNDGLPDSLEGWIRREGVYCFKVKITGTDVAYDVARTCDVYQAASSIHRHRSGRRVLLEVDSNEASPSAAAVVEYLRRLREASEETFDALLFVEQPTSRDLAGRREDMQVVSALKPVLIDEGLQSLDALPLAAETGWSGAALKTCKTHSLTLLCIAWCELRGMPYAMVDLTNPGLAAVHAAVLAGHASPFMGIELNCRQFVPRANARLAEHMPGLTRMQEGQFDLTERGRIGLGYPPGLLPDSTAA